MKEELYIIRDDRRLSVDLSTPSGITLQLNSALLSDLSKLTASHSYTFNLPLTRRNREAFDMIEDIRHGSQMYGARLKAEYRLNGLPLFRDGNIYIDEVSGGYRAVMTWQLAGGFDKLKDEDIDLCELESLGTYRVGLSGGADNEPGIPYNDWHNDMDVTRPWYTPGYPGASPQPVVPIYRIVELINRRYGTSFDFGAPYKMGDEDNDAHDIIKYGVVPLTTRKHPDYSVPVKVPFNANELITVGKTGNCLPLSETIGVYLSISDNKIMVNEVYRYSVGYDNVAYITIKGEIKIWYGLNEGKPSDGVELVIYGRCKRIGTLGEIKKVATVTCDIEERGNGRYYIFNIEEEIKQGLDKETLEWIDSVFIGFSEGVKIPSSVSVHVTPEFREWRGGYDIYVTENLPEISCLTFMKSLFYMIGVFPVTTSDGSVKPAYFNDLRDNLAMRHYVDWSGKMNGSISRPAENIKFAFGGLGQRSFFLMKNESLDKDGEEGYLSNKSHLVTENGMLDKNKTIIQLPFYGASTAVGRTINAYKVEDKEIEWQDPKPAVGMIKEAESANWLRPLGASAIPIGGKKVLGMGIFQFPLDLVTDETFSYLQSIARRPYVVTESFRLSEFDIRDLDYSVPVYLTKYNSFFAVVSVQYAAGKSAKAELVKLSLTTKTNK